MSKDEKWLVVSRSGSTRSVSSITSLNEQNGDIGRVKFFPFSKKSKTLLMAQWVDMEAKKITHVGA